MSQLKTERMPAPWVRLPLRNPTASRPHVAAVVRPALLKHDRDEGCRWMEDLQRRDGVA